MCALCRSERFLLPRDLVVVAFYERVRDLVDNLTPLGTKSGRLAIVPRLADWLAALRIYRVPEHLWEEAVDGARLILSRVYGGPSIEFARVAELPLEDLYPGLPEGAIDG